MSRMKSFKDLKSLQTAAQKTCTLERQLTDAQLEEIRHARQPTSGPPESWSLISKRLGIPYLATLGSTQNAWTREDDAQLYDIWRVERQELIVRCTAKFKKEGMQKEIIEDQLFRLGLISGRLVPEVGKAVLQALSGA